MYRNEDFLEAIRQRPFDDLPRLVFADWLEEQQNPWSKFIRLQCRLAKLKRRSKTRSKLASLERKLLNRYAGQWLGELGDFPIYHYRFKRGMLEELGIDAADYLEHAAKLHRAAPTLACLWLLEPNGVIDQIARCVWLNRIRALKLSHNYLADQHLCLLMASRRWDQLRSLDLSHNRLTSVGLEAIVWAKDLRNLRWLSLWENRIQHRAIELLAYARNLGKLKSLNLSANELSAPCLEPLSRANRSPFPRLKRLQLSRNQLGDEGVRTLGYTPWLHPVRRLNLSENEITSAGAAMLAGSPFVEHVRWLQLDLNQIDDEGAERLANSPYLKNLKRLDLRYNRLTEIGIQTLASQLPGVELYLGHNDIDAPILALLSFRFGNRVRLVG